VRFATGSVLLVESGDDEIPREDWVLLIAILYSFRDRQKHRLYKLHCPTAQQQHERRGQERQEAQA